jgi:hypothetical protein
VALDFHVVANGRYFHIAGTAAAPVVDVGPIDIHSPWATITAQCVLVLDEGQTIWVGGNGASGNGLFLSTDGGLTWTDKTSTLPAPLGGSEAVLSLAYDADTETLCGTLWEGATGCWTIKYDAGADSWSTTQSFGGNSAPSNILVQNGVWYITVSAGANLGVWRSLDDGDTWTKDTSITQTGYTGGIENLAVGTDDNFCCVQAFFAASNWRARARFGAFGDGPFTPEMLTGADDWTYANANTRLYGRLMHVDESDVMWYATRKDNYPTIFKRTPDGTWSIERTSTTSGWPQGMSVASSAAIWVGGSGAEVNLYDGLGWSQHTLVSIHAQLTTTMAVYGPPPTPISAAEIRRRTMLRTLVDLYPPGAYPKEVDRNDAATVFGDWHEHIDTEALVQTEETVDQLQLEVFPQKAQQTLAEWEAFLQLDTISTEEAARQAEVTGAARAATLLTPRNLRAVLVELLNSVYGFWDHGTIDVLSHYDVARQSGNGTLSEGATGLQAEGTSPEQLDWAGGNDARVEHAFVDRDDTFVLQAELQASTLNTDTATGIFVRDGDNGIFVGAENISGTTRARARRLQDGVWSELGDVAIPGLPDWYQIERDSEGLIHCHVGTLGSLTEIAADVEITWRPLTWGISSRNLSPWNTVLGRWQDIRIAYGDPINNVELHEQHEAGTGSNIFAAFVHRDPDDGGSYRLIEAVKLLNRICWGHTVITVGESDAFRTDDGESLTDRDILSL